MPINFSALSGPFYVIVQENTALGIFVSNFDAMSINCSKHTALAQGMLENQEF